MAWHVTRHLINILNTETETGVRTKKEIRSYNMSRIRSRGTSIEKQLSSELRRSKIKHRKNVKTLPGKPDFILKDKKIAIFCDSGFWHGKDYPSSVERIKTNRDFWKNKLERNILRDKEVTRELKTLGWEVMRFWDDEIKHTPERVVKKIIEKIS